MNKVSELCIITYEQLFDITVTAYCWFFIFVHEPGIMEAEANLAIVRLC